MSEKKHIENVSSPLPTQGGDGGGSLKEKTAKGLFWGLLNNGTMQVLNLVIGIFLLRLLTPADYGIVGVLAIFTAIAGDLQSAGFTQALINIKNPTDRDYNSVFWFNVLVSIGLYTILFFSAPLIAWYFHQPVLVDVSRFVFLAFLISSLGIAHSAYLTKNLMVREQAISSVVALIVSGLVSITLAFRGMAYWSIAWQQVIYISVLNVMRLHYSRWRPTLKIDFGPVRKMFKFAVNLLITKIITSISQNVLTFIFGRMFPIQSVGYFTQANKWSTMAHSFVSGTVHQVAQPVLAEAVHDDEREKRIFRKMVRFTAFIAFPALFGLALIAKEFTIVAIGEKWLESVPLLQLLCIGGAFMPFYAMYQNLVISKGRSDIYMWCNVAQIVSQIALILFFGKQGILVMVEVYTIFNILYLAVWHWQAQRVLNLHVTEILKDILPFMLIALLVMAATYFVTLLIANPILLLIARIVIAAVLYFMVMKLAGAEIMKECMQFMLKKGKH
ncbi:MAG: lipopolysaccharide biosynthesis protein [Prevotella sp.]|nr:lipopolysaccharide biosynthesis protein [Prevotella sp.]